MIQVKNVSWKIGRKQILRDVSVIADTGEVVAIVGPNGAGKSTLLKLMTGDLIPSTGSVEMMGKAIGNWTPSDLAKRRAVLMQQSTLSFAFSAFEVALMGRIPHNNGIESSTDVRVALEALVLVGLEQFSDRLYPTLSGGEQQRVQLARILAQIWDEPAEGSRYLLLDEPTASLDLAYQQQTLRIARQFADEGAVVIAILHDLNLAAQYADRIVMLKNGQVHAAGKPDAVLNAQLIEEVFEVPVYIVNHPLSGQPLVAVSG